jgi:4-amino-4-deoxy-L-arabinose transferase-like glycosyltransferase
VLTRPRALRGRRRRVFVPGPLAALALPVAILGVAWALIVPPFQAPDETNHFAYAQSLATRFALPGDQRRPLGVSADESLADAAVGASNLAFKVGSVRPDWSARDYAAYLALARHHPSQSDGGGPNSQAVNPPLFYLYSDLAYWTSGSDNAFGRLYAMRLWGVVLLLATIAAAWLLAGEVFGRRRLPQLICAAVSGLIPMVTFISTSVTPDALLIPLWTLALWLGARLIRRSWHTTDAVALCAITAAAILTKATSYALLPAVAMALVVGWRTSPAAGRRAALPGAAAALATLVVPVLGWLALTRSLGRPSVNTIQTPAGGRSHPFSVLQFLAYVWEFYLPRLGFMSKITTTPGLSVFDVWLRGAWADFGWLDVLIPAWIYPVLGVVTSVVGIAGAAVLITVRGWRRAALPIFFALAALALVAGLHLTEYRSLVAGEGPLLQGRYLLPLIGLFGLTVALVLARIPPRWRGIAAGVVLAALLLLQVVSLATIAKVYYT